MHAGALTADATKYELEHNFLGIVLVTDIICGSVDNTVYYANLIKKKNRPIKLLKLYCLQMILLYEIEKSFEMGHPKLYM